MATNNFLLNVVATVTTTLSTGDLVSDMKHRIFPLPLHPLLNKETALPHVRNVSDAISIPLHLSVLQKVVDSARHVVSGDRRFVTMSGMPFVTICISVDHGVVSADGEFDADDDDYEDDEDDEDDYDYDDDEEEDDEDEEPPQKEVEKGGNGGACRGTTLEVKSVVVEEQGKVCAICLERFEVSCEAIRLRCGHLYHRDCIGNWLQKGKRQCPVCRSQIP
ncbi:unnamed protein product [Linum trigynum]|uniref:RING-type domain-containing protein n=1 Tax=Linum trigynum TaxID=586398 RepID=A0AAV2D607_9ROSI